MKDDIDLPTLETERQTLKHARCASRKRTLSIFVGSNVGSGVEHLNDVDFWPFTTTKNQIKFERSQVQLIEFDFRTIPMNIEIIYLIDTNCVHLKFEDFSTRKMFGTDEIELLTYLECEPTQ